MVAAHRIYQQKVPFMQFVLTAYDRPGALSLRLETRPTHLDYLRSIVANIVVGGPILDSEGKPCGSIIIYEADDLAAAEKLVSDDPYSRAGLFERWEVRPYKVVVKGGEVTP